MYNGECFAKCPDGTAAYELQCVTACPDGTKMSESECVDINSLSENEDDEEYN